MYGEIARSHARGESSVTWRAAGAQVCLTNKAILTFFDKRRKVKRLNFVNIREPGYSPTGNGGVSFEDAMRHFHVIDGSHVRGAIATSPLPTSPSHPTHHAPRAWPATLFAGRRGIGGGIDGL